jgi:hypothetical protein
MLSYRERALEAPMPNTKGCGPRHKYAESKSEVRERELREARREIDRLQHQLHAIQSTLQTVNRLSAHYVVVNGRKLR